MNSVKEWLQGPLSAVGSLFSGASRTTSTIAIFFDGDGVPVNIANCLVDYLGKRGRVVSSRVHANFTSPLTKAWAQHCRRYGTVAVQCFSVVPGKNAADISLAIDAVDYSTRSSVDTVAIASSDSDLTPLVHYLRMKGIKVLGFGAKQTPESFKTSCREFISFAELQRRTASFPQIMEAPARFEGSPGTAEQLVLLALISMGGASRWVSLPSLRSELNRLQPDFHPRRYRRRTLTELLTAIDTVEVNSEADPPVARLGRARNDCIPRQG